MYANTEKFYCFGSGASGDVLDFIQWVEGLTLPEAIRRLDGGPGPVHMLRAPGLDTAQAKSLARFSFGCFTTDEYAREAGPMGIEACLTANHRAKPLHS